MSDLSQRITGLDAEKRALLELHLKQQGGANVFPLSFAQERLWFLDQLDPGSALYTIPLLVRLQGSLDVAALNAALNDLIQRHESLRTTFTALEGRPVQVVARALELPISLIDLREQLDRETAARDLVQAELLRQFDLVAGPLLRATLLHLDDGEHLLLLAMHHIISDGWSLGVLIRELVTCYQARRAAQPVQLPVLPIQYADYAAWQRKRLSGKLMERQLGYWREQLSGSPSLLELPTNRPRPTVLAADGTTYSWSIPQPLAAALTTLSQRTGTTLFMTLLAAFQVLLARYSGQTDIVVGSPVAGRTRPDLEGLIGFFVNMLALRSDLADNLSFHTLLGRVRETTLAAQTHQDLPFEKLVEALQPERDLRTTPIFQVVFVLQNTPLPALDLPDLSITALPVVGHSAKFDLSLTMHETEAGLAGVFEYRTALFDAATIARLAEHLQILLAGVVADPHQPVASLTLSSAAEQQQLAAWNETAAPFAEDRCLHQLIEEQAARTPEAIAVIHGQQRYTYAELNRRANQIAHELRARGVGGQDAARVGICADPSIEQITGVLGILKAGAAYVPLDPRYPAERLALLVADSQIQVALTQAHLQDKLPTSLASLCLDRDWPEIAQQPVTNPHLDLTSEYLAYIIYTSGSTGTPKGTLLGHRGAVNNLCWRQRSWPLTETDNVLLTFALSFDPSVWNIFWPLMAGARLILVSAGEEADSSTLVRMMREHRVTIYGASPTLHAVLLDEPDFAETHLRYVVSGGEPLTIDIQRRFHQQSSALLCNCYGPTETTIDATFWLSRQDAEPQPAPIGRPVPNAQAYVLDRQLQPVPIGAPGELYIGGAGLAVGYLNRPDLTAEKFVPNPFAASPGARLYRTGDLARFRSDGNIEFLGRADNQVKIRGFRIELGEIEAMLRQHPAITEAAVVVHEHATSGKRLVAYVVENKEQQNKEQKSTADLPSPTAQERDRGVRAGGEGLPASLRSFLRERLPEYMIPAAFVPLDTLPLTPSGKLDRRALPAPGETHIVVGPHEAPQTELERTIAVIWRALLEIETVGREDNFFDLGGHSLLMVQARHRLIAALDREIAMVDLFRYPTIRTLASFLGGPEQPASASLAPSQERAARRRELLAAPPARQETGAAPAFDREIAVVGLSGRFPGAPDIDSFWRNLCNGVESIALFSEQELLESGISPALLAQPGYVRAGGALDNIDRFDAAFFGYSPREAEIMDPQQRLFLECAWTALEHAGYAPDNIAVPTGVYAGVSLNRYWLNLASNLDLVEALGSFHTVMSNDRDFLTTRISYKLNLHGPSLNIQTACSTSLVAIHTACQALLHHECDMALAGGVSIAVPTKSGYLYQEGGIHSPDGHCRAFDARAQGTVGGSGMGVVVLKRLSSALADGDQIYAVIKGSALNNDGSQKVGYTAPSVEGQARVIAEALATAGVAAESISYVETHGTATALGDPIEVAALTEAYRASTDATGFCALGSVKTNIGHLDAAAGVAGLIKATLALKHGQIPPSLHYEAPNPAIDFASSPFYVNNKLTQWQPAGQPRRAGVSSFGIGGTNAHVVLEEAPAIVASTPTSGWQILLLSAKTGSALDAATTNLAAFLRKHPETELADVAYTLQVGRSAFNHRRLLVCRDHEDAAQALESRDPQHVFTQHHEAEARSVAFMFPGGGGQYARMAQELYASQPVFRAWIDRCAELLRPSLQLDIRSLIFPGDDQVASAAQQLRQTDLALPALFAIEYGLAQLWISWGVKPSAMIGHSLGEYVAACLAGVFTLEDALALVTARGKLMMQLPAGMMLSIALPEAELRAKLQPGLAIAAINAPALCVVSGTAQAVIAFEQALRAEGIDCRRVPIEVAAHSPLVEPILAEFARCVESLRLNPPQIPCISGMSGSWLTAAEATDPRYWVRHLRQTVRFADGIAELLKDSQPILLEVGPGRALSSAARLQASAEREVRTLTSLPGQHDQQSDAAFLLNTLGRLWLAGVPIDWQAWHAPARRLRLALPTYPFDRQRYWIDAQPTAGRDLLPIVHADPRDWLYAPSWKRTLPPRRVRPAELEQQPRRWLVFSDDCGSGERLVERLAAAGQDVTTVRIGAAFGQVSDYSYTLCPERLEGYEQLLQSLQAAGQLPHTIVHLWNVTAERAELPAIERVKTAQARGLYSLIFLAQALGNHAAAESISLGVVSNQLYRVTGDEQIAPEKSMILAACKSISQEYPQITCRSLDVLIDNAEAVSEQIIAELAGETTSGEVAYRGGHRWQPTFEPIPAEPGGETRLRERGVYLVTGGLGGVGLVLAEHLAQRSKARLILTGRSALPERESWADWLAAHPHADPTSRKIAALQHIEALGAEVLALSADVADLEQMRAAVVTAEQRFGPIHGVIHAAGVAGGGMIQYRKPDEIAQSLAPKVQGALVLDAVFADRPLDFLALCSSLNAIAGGFGLVDYCAANIYLDSFAQARQSTSAPYTVSINWDLWRGVGMAAKPRLTSGLAAENHASRTGMEPQQGTQIFERILDDGQLPQVVVSRIEPRALQEQALHFNRTAVMAALEQMQAPQLDTLPAPHARRDLPTEYVAPRSELEEQIARIWEQLLGVAQIGVHDNFFDLGGHSLLAIQLVAQLRAQCQAEVSLHTLFEAPTIGQLAERIGGSAEQGQQARTIEEMLQMVEHLSDEEVAALLGQSEGTTLP